ncbi:MAG: cytochrome b/b6 domain-containing protein [Chloroflexi bacterium]|nr:cytochrome b/b6 domain-containing protein [Chloroflexota bacterium]
MMRRTRQPFILVTLVLGLLLMLVGLTATLSAAQDAPPVSPAVASPLHPVFPLLDVDGAPVIGSGKPVSTLKTCGECHDTAFITQNATHNGVSTFTGGSTPGYGDDLLAAYLNNTKDVPAGAVEMNCFLCHTAQPNNAARVSALQAGDYAWANTATLLGTGIVEQTGNGWIYNAAAFDETGALKRDYVTVQDPTSAACGQCHGVVHTDAQTPLTFDATGLDIGQYKTLTTGQVMSPQRLSSSGLNLADKNALSRSWDVHAERVLNCTNCHYSLNNPVYFTESSEDRPDHLVFDPRRMDFGEYLKRPLHQFAKGQSAVTPEINNTMRRCESCHSIEATHNWLPYKERHTEAMACETCHIPQVYAPALESVDWTVPAADGSPHTAWRGLAADDPALLTGYQPVMLPRANADGSQSLAPFNLVTSWYWAYGDEAQPVPLDSVKAAYFDGETYAADVLAAFDVDGDGALSDTERLIDTAAKETFIAARLKTAGFVNAKIVGEVQPFAINHNVAWGDWAIRDCRTCHGEDSRLTAALVLSDRTPGGALPTFTSLEGFTASGLHTDDTGALRYEFKPAEAGLYIFGHSAVDWLDWLGVLFFLGTLAGVTLHGGLRYLSVRRRVPQQAELKRVYMYSVYERQWHWLQTALIFGLIFTGLVIHKPDKFGIFSFDYIVQVHNILAIILLINAALAAFYHLASGEIQQFLPKPHGFFNDAIMQAKYYLRGIFKGEEHPFAKTRQRKMNPLQQMTYLMILNVLLPAQVITGILMWGAQHFPDVTASLGGLPFLAPLHTIVAWLFASFIVAHVYLTTTGHTPLTNIKAMISGWDEVEAHDSGLNPKEQTS